MFEPSHETYSFGEFMLDVSGRRFLRGQNEIKLTTQPFKALLYLVKNPNKLITKDELISAVRGKDVNLTPDAPKKWIDHIRDALDDQDHLIEIVRGEGLRFNADVKANSPTLYLQASGALSEEVNSDTRTATLSISDSRPPHQEIDKESTPAQQVAEDVSKGSKDRTETFEGWMGGRGMAISLTLFTCVVATAVLSFSLVYPSWNNAVEMQAAKEAAMKAASRAQCLVILIALLHSWLWNKAKGFSPNEHFTEADIIRAGFENAADFENDKEELENELKRYTKYWRWLLLSWIPLYILFATGDLKNDSAKVLLITFNLVNTLMVALCFHVLNKDPNDEDNEHLPGLVLNAAVFIILFGVLALLIKNSNFDGAILLTGIAAGVTVALYVGRLQSKFLGPRFWMLYLLYSYTAIQPLVLYLKDHPGWGVIILDFALFLKCLLYLYITWLFQSGLLLFYFARMKRSQGTVRDQREAFRNLLE